VNTRLLADTTTPIVALESDVVALDDALAIVAAAYEHQSAKILLHEERLPPAFFELKSGFAGEFVQKLVNYQLTIGAVFSRSAPAYSQRFGEYIAEARRGRQFRAFQREEDAIRWLDAAT
jgi:hypothetical protein